MAKVNVLKTCWKFIVLHSRESRPITKGKECRFWMSTETSLEFGVEDVFSGLPAVEDVGQHSNENAPDDEEHAADKCSTIKPAFCRYNNILGFCKNKIRNGGIHNSYCIRVPTVRTRKSPRRDMIRYRRTSRSPFSRCNSRRS